MDGARRKNEEKFCRSPLKIFRNNLLLREIFMMIFGILTIFTRASTHVKRPLLNGLELNVQ